MISKNKICIIGWHYLKDFYLTAKQDLSNVYIVSHRYNKILDELNMNYTITKNVGLEHSAYDWYIKNRWDKESSVLFMHDDIEIVEKNIINNIIKKCEEYDYVSILGRTCAKEQKYSNRCFYFSKKMIECFLSNFDGIWYDPYNKGYTLGTPLYYDKLYTKAYNAYCSKAGRSIKESLKFLIHKYKLKSTIINDRGIILCRRGNEKKFLKKLNDNTIFGRDENDLENILSQKKYIINKGRAYHYYIKYYNFYFDKIKNDNLNILEIGVKDYKPLNMWKEYFKNSDVYGIAKKFNDVDPKHMDRCKIFRGKQVDTNFLKKVNLKIPHGIDIIIDSGSKNSNDDKIKTFKILFEEMNPGGIYVIEDIQYFYSKYSKKNNKVIKFLKIMINNVNFNGNSKTNNFEKIISSNIRLNKYERTICGISFHPGMCFIFKRFCK